MRKVIGGFLLFLVVLGSLGLAGMGTRKDPGMSAEEKLGEMIGGVLFVAALAWLGLRLWNDPRNKEKDARN